MLGGLLGFVCLNAVGGGIYGMAGAEGVPTAWLQGSFFTNYFIPSLILCFGVGGVCGTAAWAVFAGANSARLWALFAAAVLIGWIVAQVLIIGFVSGLQPAVAGTALLIAAVALTLPRTRNAARLIRE
ncbi:MAG: hypothetical protein SF187_20080 [Deltaproteobacteria bacterium]|nr:hypothetical protein [Deltaproteobacteria bacterium]